MLLLHRKINSSNSKRLSCKDICITICVILYFVVLLYFLSKLFFFSPCNRVLAFFFVVMSSWAIAQS